MNRRNWLSSIGVSAAGSLAAFSAATDSQANKRPWVLSLESFRVSHAEQMTQLHSYLGGTFLSYLAQVHRGPRMFLEAIVAPHTPQALVVTAFQSFDEMIEIRHKLAAHPGIQRARPDLESPERHRAGAAFAESGNSLHPAATGSVVARVFVESQILIADSLQFRQGPDHRRGGIFELRSYQAPSWRDTPPAAANAAFQRAGIDPIVIASAAGEHLPRFTYLIPFENLAVRQEAWARLGADSEWSGLKAKVTAASIYKLAPYSPLS